MEHHKKHHEFRSPQKDQRQKCQFFKQVFQECEKKFSEKQFEFFIKCMIPNGNYNNRSLSAKKKMNNLASHQQNEPSINDIHPNVLTMPRKINFYEEKCINNLRLERKNKRLLTTPTERVQKQIRFNCYQDYTLYRRMQDQQDNLAQNLKQSKIGQKLYSPEPLFYPSWRNEPPKLILTTTGKFRSKQKEKSHYQMKFRYQDDQNSKQNLQFIPDNFVQIVRQSSNKSFRYSKTGYVRLSKY